MMTESDIHRLNKIDEPFVHNKQDIPLDHPDSGYMFNGQLKATKEAIELLGSVTIIRLFLSLEKQAQQSYGIQSIQRFTRRQDGLEFVFVDNGDVTATLSDQL